MDAPKGTRPMLAFAAQNIAAVSGVAETVVDVLHVKALRHYAEGLRQYLALRVGATDLAKQALGEVRGVAAALGAEELIRPPGIRARLYRLAREQGVAHGGPDGTDQRARLPWRNPPAASEAYLGALARLRTDLDPDAAELLELRFARELSIEEIAHVLDRDPDALRGELDTGLSRAREIGGGDLPESHSIEDALLEAFALEKQDETTDFGGESVEPLAEGTIIGGRYEVAGRVGSGSFSDVYRAKDIEVPGHVVALKLLHQPSLSDEAKDAALRELHLIASVFHPSIVQFKDNGWHEGRLWFVMPWYEGEPLESRIARHRLSRREARAIFEPLARALAAMHAVGIRHQDVKPDNILLAKLEGFGLGDGTGVLPVLIDLGVAAKEAEMVVAGTPTYFPPEVAAQFAKVDIQYPITTKADVFSLSLALRNSLEPETQDDVPAGAVETFIQYRAENPPDMPSGGDLKFLRPYFERWMALDPDARPTAEELAAELAVLTRPEDRRARTVSVMKWLVPLAITVAVTFGAIVYVLAQQAELQELEARQARLENADALADLSEESDRRRELEDDVNRLQQEYRSSTLSREELATKLGETEGQLGQTRGLLGTERRRARTLRETLTSTRETLTETRGELDTTRADLGTARRDLETERTRTAELTDQVAGLREDLGDARAEADRSRARVTELDGEIAALRSRLAAEEARNGVLDRRIAEAEAARTRAEANLTASNRRVTQLEREVARLSAQLAAATGGGGGGADPSPPGDPP